MFRTPATSRLALLCAAAALFCAGCFDTSSDVIVLTYPTLLTVDPLLFRGNVSCGSPGLVRYVVTLKDVTDRSNIVTLPSSVPVPCQSPISYGEGKVIVNHFYAAIIEGYDRDVYPNDAGADPRPMYDGSGNLVSPAWTTLCGDDTFDPDASNGPNTYDPLRNPTLLLANTENVLRGCAAFAPRRPGDASTSDGGTLGDGGISNDATNDMSIDAEPPRDGGADSGRDARDAAVDSADATMTPDVEIDVQTDAIGDPNLDTEPTNDAPIDTSDAEIDVPADAPSDGAGLDVADVHGDEGGSG